MRLELGHLADEVGVEGTARVVSVSAAPAVAAGPGRVCCSRPRVFWCFAIEQPGALVIEDS